jgi:hypothetical protein
MFKKTQKVSKKTKNKKIMKNIKLLKYLALFLFFSFQLSPLLGQQVPEIMWDKTFGGSGQDSLSSIQQTSDGGYILAGNKHNRNGLDNDINNRSDYWIVKLDGMGSEVWDKSFGDSFEDRATSIQQTSDGGYIVGGYSRTVWNDEGSDGSGNPNYLILKLDELGNKVWDKSFETKSYSSNGNFIQQTSDGDYVVTFEIPTEWWKNSDCRILKLDESGNEVWDKTYGGSSYDRVYSIQQTSDGGYIVAGSTYSNDGDISDGNNGLGDYWVLKLDGSGNKEWDKTYGGSSNDKAYSIQQTSDGGYIVAGSTQSNSGDISDGNNGNVDYWILKLDESGNKVWDKTLGGSSYDSATSIQQTSDGGYIVAGSTKSSDSDITDSNNGKSDNWIIKLDESGNKVWDKTLGGSDSDNATSIQQTSDGGYIVAGTTSSNDGDITDGNNGSSDFWIIKLGAETPQNINQIESKNTFSMYPNPANSQIVIVTDLIEPIGEVLITDMTGKIIKQFQTQKSTTEIDISTLENGIYFVKAGGVSQKLVKK